MAIFDIAENDLFTFLEVSSVIILINVSNTQKHFMEFYKF